MTIADQVTVLVVLALFIGLGFQCWRDAKNEKAKRKGGDAPRVLVRESVDAPLPRVRTLPATPDGGTAPVRSPGVGGRRKKQGKPARRGRG